MSRLKVVKIGNKLIGQGNPVFIIAEIGVNHNGDIKLARKMIDIAVETGVDAVKFQSYRTEKIMTKTAPSAAYHKRAAGNKESWYDLLKRLELSRRDQEGLFNYCVKKRIIFLSTAYDAQSADFLNNLGVATFKIASTDTNNIPLLIRVAKFSKPILLSTGMSTFKEVRESVAAIRKEGNDKIILLQCTANYPPRYNDLNLNVLDTFRKKLDVLVGYSDHLGAYQAVIAAVAKGISVYEAHYTLNKNMPGPDHKSSLEPQELKRIVGDIRWTETFLGSYDKKVTPSERETRLKLRKSIVAISDIKQGDTLSEKNIGICRPGNGLQPKYIYKLLGKKSVRDIAKEELISVDDTS